MKINYEPKLTFSDVLLRPSYSDIVNRDTEIDLTTHFLGYSRLPIISANMDYVTDVNMALAMEKNNAFGILNRFSDEDTQLKFLQESGLAFGVISVGIRDLAASILKITKFEPYIHGVCIDVAHGEHVKVVSLIKIIKETYPHLGIIAGNVATPEGFSKLAIAGAHAIKVGIGPGSVCTTREVTGVGVPQFSAILDCAAAASLWNIPLIADGGINSSGDIVKALAAGADVVMLGRLLAGHDECPIGPADVTKVWPPQLRPYRGQSSIGINKVRLAPEGISGFVPAKGPVSETIKSLVGGIKSGLAYVGARNLTELRDKAVFNVVSANSREESGTRVRTEI